MERGESSYDEKRLDDIDARVQYYIPFIAVRVNSWFISPMRLAKSSESSRTLSRMSSPRINEVTLSLGLARTVGFTVRECARSVLPPRGRAAL
jgi:hypothetical protein